MITYIDDNDVKNNLPVKECVDELKEAAMEILNKE